jgi:hypothetical protein
MTADSRYFFLRALRLFIFGFGFAAATGLGITFPNSSGFKHFAHTGRPFFISMFSKSSLPCSGQKHLACMLITFSHARPSVG